MRRNLKHFTLVIVLLAFLLVQAACSFPFQSVGPFGPQQPVASDVLRRASAEQWVSWIEQLSGAKPVRLGGETTTIDTRSSWAMFNGQPNARAFEFVHEQAGAWVPAAQIEVHSYPSPDGSGEWKNLIVTLPGVTRPAEVVALSAHLDSTAAAGGDPLLRAPGADDNATGVAAVLEALRLLSGYRFERTLRFVFFTGEEDRLLGSRAYLQDHSSEDIVAVLNLDMFGYDGDGDRCFELHVGALPGSDQIGQAFIRAIQTHRLNLRYDYLTGDATDRSDHAAFWEQGIPAVTVIENLLPNQQPQGCQGVDFNPYYHTANDTLDKLDVDYGFSIAQAAILTVVELARPLPRLEIWP